MGRNACLLLCTMLLAAACDSAPREDDRGFLYFGSGRYLGKLDLADGSSTIAANAGDVNIVDVSAGRDNTVLLGVTAPSGYLEVDRILRVDITTGRRTSLYTGTKPRYLPGPKTVIYDDGHQLLTVGLRTDTPVIYTHSQNALVAVIVISPDEILFEVRDDDTVRVFRYNGRTEFRDELPLLAALCMLDTAVWIESVERLACQARDVAGLLLVAIDGQSVEPIRLPEGKQFRPLAFAAGQQAMILAEDWQSWLAGRPRVAIWSYDLDTQRGERLFKHREIGKSVMYSTL